MGSHHTLLTFISYRIFNVQESTHAIFLHADGVPSYSPDLHILAVTTTPGRDHTCVPCTGWRVWPLEVGCLASTQKNPGLNSPRITVHFKSCGLHTLWLYNEISTLFSPGGWDSTIGKVLDSWSKGGDFVSQLKQRENVLLCLCWLLFSVWSIPVLQQWHVKDCGHFAKVQVAG